MTEKLEFETIAERRKESTILAPNSNHHPGPHATTAFQLENTRG